MRAVIQIRLPPNFVAGAISEAAGLAIRLVLHGARYGAEGASSSKGTEDEPFNFSDFDTQLHSSSQGRTQGGGGGGGGSVAKDKLNGTVGGRDLNSVRMW